MAARGIVKRLAAAGRTCKISSERAALANLAELAAAEFWTSVECLNLSRELVHEINMAVLSAPIVGSRRRRL